jgi:hypothetical protein
MFGHTSSLLRSPPGLKPYSPLDESRPLLHEICPGLGASTGRRYLVRSSAFFKRSRVAEGSVSAPRSHPVSANPEPHFRRSLS